MSKVAVYLQKKKPAQLVMFARNVHSSMTAEAAVFTQPPVAMADFLADISVLTKAIEDALDGGRKYISLRDAAIRKVQEDLRELANYVQNVSKGSADIIYSAGFEIAHTGPRRYESVDTPVGLKATCVGGGIIKLTFKRVKRARIYQVEMCMENITEDGWKLVQMNSTTSVFVSGLLTGARYYFRARAFGSETLQSNWSDLANAVAF
ncbi:MAG: fibronectin type III domain-containing protein [Sphingobacteriales bacterium]|nr:MAG: fibronectin type III domain-containing protein [Sphingobacteriales bacterium]